MTPTAIYDLEAQIDAYTVLDPDDIEKAGYSVATKARLSGAKVREIGWLPRYDIESGIKRTVQILKEIQKSV